MVAYTSTATITDEWITYTFHLLTERPKKHSKIHTGFDSETTNLTSFGKPNEAGKKTRNNKYE